MHTFLKKNIKDSCFELEIDTHIFSKQIVLKTAYQYLDLGYFFFKSGENDALIVQFKPKSEQKTHPETIIGNFSDSLLEMCLRDTLERENRVIREAIVTKALFGVYEDPQTHSETGNNLIELGNPNVQEPTLDFDRDIEDIIKEIENDPDLQIDEEEIQKMLDEIESDNSMPQSAKPTIRVDPSNIDGAKDLFKKK